MHTIIRLTDIDRNGEFQIGGKAANLVRLMAAGMPVPDAWVVPAEVFCAHLISHDLETRALAAVEDPQEACCRFLREAILEMDLSADLTTALAELPDVPLAVRSSASVEDGARGSYSGLFKTCLGVRKGQALLDAVREVWASVFTPQVLAYHRRVSEGEDYPLMGVLMMPMVAAEVSGVAFSANPGDGNPFQIVVTACLGLGTTVVDGKDGCGQYVLDLDCLETLEIHKGSQGTGDFVQSDGRVETMRISPNRGCLPVLSDARLRQLGEVVRSIDEILGYRVDVEFAFHAGDAIAAGESASPFGGSRKGAKAQREQRPDSGACQGKVEGRSCRAELVILQAREVLGLPPYFPDDPTREDPNAGWGHEAWGDPLSPFARVSSTVLTHPEIPVPPWPPEVTEVSIHLGRIFGRAPEDPDCPAFPDESWKDRTFLKRMQALENPEDDFREWGPWTDHAYCCIIPELRRRSEALLSLSGDELRALDRRELGAMLQKAMDLQDQAGVFYVSSSYPTAKTLTWVQALASDWLMDGDWRKSDMFAVTMVQGAPKLTHERDAELQAIAWDGGDLDGFIKRWGYSYLVRDELLDISRWQSWREDPAPLHAAVKQMRASKARRPIQELVRDSARESHEAFARALRQIRDADAENGETHAKILAACVKACRTHNRMKDDRDLVLSHAQSALRWVLMEVGRRLRRADIVAAEDDVCMFEPQELLAFFEDGGDRAATFRTILSARRREQARLSRYTLSLTDHADDEAPPEGDVVQGDPASPGIAEGRACVVRVEAYEDISGLEAGDILVLKGEGKVGWTIFFTTIAGLVYSNGNWLCHETTLCRELGKPAVVGLGEQADAIRGGERLRIDGSTGMVYLLDRTL